MWLAKLAANLSANEDDFNNDVLDKNNQAYGEDDFQSYGLDPNEGWWFFSRLLEAVFKKEFSTLSIFRARKRIQNRLMSRKSAQILPPEVEADRRFNQYRRGQCHQPNTKPQCLAMSSTTSISAWPLKSNNNSLQVWSYQSNKFESSTTGKFLSLKNR